MSDQFLHYAYAVSDRQAVYPLLGSLVRAMGKGWRVAVLTHEQKAFVFEGFHQLLKNPTQLVILSGDTLLTELDSNSFQLIVVDADSSKTKDKFRRQLLETSAHTIWIDRSYDKELYDLVSQCTEKNLHKNGVIAITGTGKGKTTTALGYAAYAVVCGKKSAVIQWFKERKTDDLTWAINEHLFPQLLNDPTRFNFFPTGLGFFGSPNMDRVTGELAYQQHRQKAYEGIEIAKKRIKSGEYQCIVLDEFIDTVKEIAQNIEYPLIDLNDVQQFMAWIVEQPVQVIVTGRRVTEDWQQYIATSIEITEVKHPWSSAQKGAVSGLDY